jgi:nanoRNase/pAp phosphatase (c-di-AMP/oligoRNAs hydrolase)
MKIFKFESIFTENSESSIKNIVAEYLRMAKVLKDILLKSRYFSIIIDTGNMLINSTSNHPNVKIKQNCYVMDI